MNLPLWIDNTDWMVQALGYMSGASGTRWGPWAFGGNLYCAAFKRQVAPLQHHIRIYKSTDSGYTWIEQDSANRPAYRLDPANGSFALRYDGTSIVYIAYTDPAALNVRLRTFNLATDTYSAEFGAAGSPVPNIGSILDVVQLPDGSIRVFYNFLVAGVRNVAWARWAAGAWGALGNVLTDNIGAGTSLTYQPGCLVMEPGGKLHLFYSYRPGVPLVWNYHHRTLTMADALSPVQPPMWTDVSGGRLTNAFISMAGDLKVAASPLVPPGWFCPGVITGVPADDAPVWTPVVVNSVIGQGLGHNSQQWLAQALDGTFHIWWCWYDTVAVCRLWHATDSGAGWSAADVWYDEVARPPLPPVAGYDPLPDMLWTSVTVYPNSTTYGTPFGVMLASQGVPGGAFGGVPLYLAFAPSSPAGRPSMVTGANCRPTMITPGTPMWDQWFTYAYNADALTDAANYQGLVIPIETDSDFILRRVSGGPQVVRAAAPPPVGRVRLYDRFGAALSSAPLHATHYRSVAVVPEEMYPAGGVIAFDLLSVLRAVNTDPITGAQSFASQLAFQGVHRRCRPPGDTTYRYHEKPYVHHLRVTVNWQAYDFDAFGVPIAFTQPQTFIVPIQNYDFELHLIRMFAANTPNPPLGWAKVWLYDQNALQVSNVPLWIDFLEENAAGSFGNVFSPPLLYQVNSQLKLDLYSLYFIGQLPSVIDFDFVGVERIPC